MCCFIQDSECENTKKGANRGLSLIQYQQKEVFALSLSFSPPLLPSLLLSFYLVHCCTISTQTLFATPSENTFINQKGLIDGFNVSGNLNSFVAFPWDGLQPTSLTEIIISPFINTSYLLPSKCSLSFYHLHFSTSITPSPPLPSPTSPPQGEEPRTIPTKGKK